MSGSIGPISCCDQDCADANYCEVGGIQCERCGLYFCASHLNYDGYCEDCAREKAEEEQEDEDEE